MHWKIASAICGLLLLACGPASAQVFMGQTVASCGTAPSTRSAGIPYPVLMDTNGNFCTNASGSGSGSAVFGPTATGSAAANPPVLIGGTVDGTATGLVQGETVKAASTAALQTDPAAVTRSADIGTTSDTVCATATGNCTLVALEKYVANAVNGAGQVFGFSSVPTSSVTRPANTTTYTANTAWCHTTSTCATVFTFANACRTNGGAVLVPEIDLWLSDHQSTALQGILWVFNVTPATVINDNASFNIATADFPNLTGSMSGFPFTMVSPQNSPSNSGVSLTGTTYHMACASGSTTLYAMVQVVNTYAPTSAEVLNVTLHAVGAN